MFFVFFNIVGFSMKFAPSAPPPKIEMITRDIFEELHLYTKSKDVTVYSVHQTNGRHFVASLIETEDEEYWFKGIGENYRRACEDAMIKGVLTFMEEEYVLK